MSSAVRLAASLAKMRLFWTLILAALLTTWNVPISLKAMPYEVMNLVPFVKKANFLTIETAIYIGGTEDVSFAALYNQKYNSIRIHFFNRPCHFSELNIVQHSKLHQLSKSANNLQNF
ncbi:hypothetical protein BpHYR1_046407 [Brachionus plicatilis]|uniref:Uncharacterized protein n=1 Tax=Brachionus plicatilis TaxID=10195 RepID=A0A3M7RHC2_BRAPC|nr:hypothetical protein BpHYR1_046407 [Brachionus plicatilis]